MYLLDTNVLSEARRRNGHQQIRRWLARAQPDDLYISVLVLGELRAGIERLRARDPKQAIILQHWFEALRDEYRDRSLPITEAIAETWGMINRASPLPVVDGLMAATAIIHKLTFVTRNTVDVSRTGVRLLDPTDSEN